MSWNRSALHHGFAGRMLRNLVGAMSIVAISSVAHASDVVNGKALALQWCASCHLVSNDQPTGVSASLPSFFDISRDAQWSDERLATFLADPHPKMPDMSLATSEIEDIAGYIGSLSRK